MQFLKRITVLAFFMLAFGVIAASAQVTVANSTGANGSYTTLKGAFDAINANATQTGNNINITITGNTTETATAELLAGNWTTLTVRPTVAATVTGSIVGAIIKLTGADNVLIDGRIGGVGTARSLTVSNSSTSAATAAVWLTSTGVGAGATGNTIRNLELACGATQDVSTNTTVGILLASNNTAISVSSGGDDNDNNSFIANRIIRARYGIVTRGQTTNNNQNITVTDNIVGPAAFGADEIGKTGILMQADSGSTVSRNTVQFVGGCLLGQTCTSGADRVGIGIGSESWSASAPGTITSGDYTVTRNFIHDVVEERTFSAAGLLAATTRGGSATNNLIANNFIYNVRANGTSGDQVVGLGIAGGFSDRIVFNSISITGDMDPGTAAASSTYGNAIRIANASGSTHANLTLMNNSIYMDVNSNTATLPFFDITINSATYSFGTGGLNYNNYYFPPANTQMNTGGITANGTAPTTALTFNTLAQWKTALTPSQDANSIQADPQYVSNTADLHIATASPNVNAGTTISGVNQDIDGQIRVGVPDIGADEPAGITPPANDIAANAFVFPTSGATVPSGTAFAPQASFINNGTAAQTNVPVRFRILDAMTAVVCNVTATIPSIDPNQTVTVTFPNCTLPGAGTYTIQASSELVGDATPANDLISGTITAVAPLSGAINVGTGGAYTSLTNTGGVFDALNAAGATSNITLNITSDLTAETGTVALNQLAGGFTVTIKPTGANRTISGSSATAIIRLNDADGVTIDGSLTGGTAGNAVGGDATLRNLTVQNNSTSITSAVILIGSNANGAQNNTVKNTNVIGNDPLTTVIGISIGGATAGAAGVDNDGNRVENCSVQKAVLGIYNAGASTTNPNTTNVITKNDLSATTTNRVQRGGILVFNQDGATISLNSIGGIDGAVGIDHYGIGAGIQDVTTTAAVNGGITNTTITRNRINGVSSTSTVGFSAYGIGIAGGTTGANTIANNLITGVTSPATSPDIVAGIFVAGVTGSSTRVYFNSVSMTGDRGAVTGQTPSFAFAITADVALELKNNNFYTTQIASGGGVNAKSYSIGTAATTFVNFDSNYNDFFASGANAGFFRTGSLNAGAGTDYATLALFAAATGDDANSQEVDPLFVDPLSNLHLQLTSPVIDDGTPIAAVTDDFDGQTRPATGVDIGADEIVAGTLALSSATYTVAENVAGGIFTFTVNRTGGSDGAVSIGYAIVSGGGGATIGASCGGGVDVTPNGPSIINFANGETSKTGSLVICDDAVFEGNETFNIQLSSPTGGATLGSPSTATVTIVDNEVAQPGTLQFNPTTYSVAENVAGGLVTLTVTRTGGSDGAVGATYALGGGSATGGAACGGAVDYINTGGTVSFTNGQTSKTFTVQICDDAVFEGNETFVATLSAATGGATFGANTTATVTITDNEVAQPGTLQFNPTTATVAENVAGGTVTLTVTRTGGTDGAVGATYALGGGTATGAAACAAGVDYVNTGGTVSFANGINSATINVTICNDAVSEASETFVATLSAATGGATLGANTTATVTITDDDVPTGPITVTATAGTLSAAYNNLTETAAAINAGTQQGAIVVSINQTITEPDTVVINSSGAGAASYTSILIRPTADNISDSGPTLTGRGLIELNGADNVTIDGDNPNSAGTNRNLTLSNTAANTVTYTSVIRVALAATIVTSADNNTFKNLNLLGSATGRNISTATSTTGTENASYGILATGGASTTTATTAPAAIASLTTTIGTGATANNLTIQNNSVNSAARAVAVQGSATTVFPGLLIENNSIGNPTAGAADQIYSMGVTAQGSTNAIIRSNLVYVESFLATQIRGLEFGSISATGSGATFERNRVLRVRDSNPATYGAYGINLGGGSNHVVQNNFVADINNDQTAGTGGFGTTFGVYGIRVASGTGHKVLHNSVNLFGVLAGTVSTDLTAALTITSTALTGLDVRNNIFANRITGGNPSGTRHVAINLPSAATVTFNLTLNNNAYYQGTDPNSRLAQVGSAFSATGVGEYFAANFDPNTTTPASNLRAYTSTLNAAGTNDNASFATTEVPPFVSNTDLHISTANPNRLESGGAAVGVTNDIDNDTRPNGTAPDIGADEFVGVRGPANDIAATAFIDPTNGGTRSAGISFSPQASFTNVGTSAQTNVTVRYRILNASMVEVYNQTTVIPSIAPGATIVATFPATSVPAGTYTIIATAENAGDTNAANNTITGTFQAFTPVSGTVSVGTGQTYTSLTNAGGIFQALNAGGASSNVTINITSDLTGETGAVALNPISGGFTVTIKPSGAARTISGTSPDSSGLIILNGADNVTIDGSLSGGTDRSLTVTNNAAAGVVIWIRSANATDGATNDTVKNTILSGASGTTTIAGILTGSSTFGVTADAPNSNNTVQNNLITRVQNAMFVAGNAATFDQNWLVTGNTFGSTTAADKLGFRGMLFGNGQNFVISNNIVNGVQLPATSTNNTSGIQIAFNNNGGTISGNRISDIKQINPTGFGSEGITLGSSGTASNITVVNNFISDVASQGTSGVTVSSNGYGIAVTTGGGYKIYFNSVNLQTNQVAATSVTAAINIAAAITTAGSIDLRDNIFVNGETIGTRYAVYSAAAATVFSTIDYNDYFAQNVGFIGGSARVTLADFQTATGQDANSKAVDPLFVSATDLHLQTGSTLINAGTAIAGITTDIDGQTRDAMPDIGADEIVAPAQPGTLVLSSPTYIAGEATGAVMITVNRTGGTDGAVSANYTLANGTASGGAACVGAADFVNTGGTINFANGQASQTFTVQICNDAVFEGNETFNVTIANATGGAVIGTPATATVTIVDDEVAQPGTLSLSSATYSFSEGVGLAALTVNRTGGSDGTVTVNFQTSNGTAIGGASCGNLPDFLLFNGFVSFANGETSKTIGVPICDDAIVEGSETFNVTLNNPTGGATIGTPAAAVITIIDNDVNFGSFAISDARVREGNSGQSTAAFTVTYTPNPTRAAGGSNVSVNYATANGTATANVDYFSTSGTLTFNAAVASTQTISVIILGDTLIEPNETFYVNLTSAVASTISDAQGVGIIVDEDRAYVSDFDRDLQTDLTVFRPSNGYWYTLQSTNNTPLTTLFGLNGDIAVPGDYDADGRTDIAVFRPSTGFWYIQQSSNFAFIQTQFGASTDKPVQGDYDGDGKTDIAVYRDGITYIMRSSTGTSIGVTFGAATDVPVQGDYDGDGKTDVAVYRPSNGTWYVLQSRTGTPTAAAFGNSTDKPIVGDFDGDGKADFTVYRSGVWYILQSLTGSVRAVTFGAATDIPAVGDYDGDGTTDIAVFRPAAAGVWYVLNSSNNAFSARQWGQTGDVPIPAAYQYQP